MRALERANSVRLARAELKRAVARGDLDPAEVVRDCPWQTESMTISELLTSQRRWGRTRARKFLMPLSLNENKQLGTLTPRQRSILSDRARRPHLRRLPPTSSAGPGPRRPPPPASAPSRAFRRSGS